MSWIINEKSQTSETQYFNGSYSTNLTANNNNSIDSVNINVAGYTSGTISFKIINGLPTTWVPPGSTLDINIIGGINSITFLANTLVIYKDDLNSTFLIDWSIALETVALRINNNTTTSTGQPIRIGNINIQTESNGGNPGHITSSGSTTGPGGITPEIQFNDGGLFGGASGALYDKDANTGKGQIQLANGTAAAPMLAFSDGTHPTGNYDTGIYKISTDDIGFTLAGIQSMGIYSADTGDFIRGLNVGLTSNVIGIRRVVASIPENSWEDGHMGNSSALVFTPADFANTDLVAGQGAVGVDSRDGDPASTTIGLVGGRWYGTVTPFVGASVIAQKIIPKGFKIVGGESTITIFTRDSTLLPPSATTITADCYVSGQVWDAGNSELLENLLHVSLTSNTETLLNGPPLPPVGEIIGDGNSMVTINWDLATAGPAIQLTSIGISISGAVITMVRI